VFAQYGLLVGLGALLPIGVLGVDADHQPCCCL
jgi:hypothetical protein